MTREEAIKELKYVKKQTGYADTALDMAIKALEREVIWEEDNAYREKKWGDKNDKRRSNQDIKATI